MSEQTVTPRELRIGMQGDQFGIGIFPPPTEEQVKAGFIDTDYGPFFKRAEPEDGSHAFVVLQSLWGFDAEEREAGIMKYVNEDLAPKLGEITINNEIVRLDAGWSMFEAPKALKPKSKRPAKQTV